MAKKVAPLKQVHKAYQTKMDALIRGSQAFSSFVDTIRTTGENSVFQRSRIENKTYDEKWVEELSIGFDAIDRIIAHPRTFIKETQDLVLAGQAKKINSTSIRHLASHTQYIHGINDEGTIIPERILSIGSDVDVQIYENRVLMSLIQRLTFFVEKRVQFISSKGETRNSDVLFMHSKTEIDGVRYEVDNRVKISVASNDNGDYEKNMKLLEKIKNLSDRVNFYIKSPFMKDMEGAKSVHSPLAMTNLLLKNPDYHKIAVLWKFMDTYTKLGISFDIEETKGEFDEAYFNEIYGLTAASLATLQSKIYQDHNIALKAEDGEEKEKPYTKTFEPKVMLSLDDEVFLTHKFRYDQFPEHEHLRTEPIRDDDEMEDFAWTPEEVKTFKETDKEYYGAELLEAKERRELADKERTAMDNEAMIKDLEARKERDRLAEEERAAEEARRIAEEKRALEELEEATRRDAEERLLEENARLEEARKRILEMAKEDEALDNSIADSLHKKAERKDEEPQEETKEINEFAPKEDDLKNAFGRVSFAAGKLQDELEEAKRKLEEKDAIIAALEAKLNNKEESKEEGVTKLVYENGPEIIYVPVPDFGNEEKKDQPKVEEPKVEEPIIEEKKEEPEVKENKPKVLRVRIGKAHNSDEKKVSKKRLRIRK
ncbi:MAG: hypothetical protein MJ228_04090 [Bacilli bacterium]|nr:hypothetical protein [Bacilli bacterium]